MLVWAQVTQLYPAFPDTSYRAGPIYDPVRLPYYDPLDTVAMPLWRLGYFKPYGIPIAPPRSVLSPGLWPSQQEAYLLCSMTPSYTQKPYTRLRFDQSSRRTQLLFVNHAQNFSPTAGIQGIYQRRTRTGEYLGQTTDHYSAGLSLYKYTSRWYIQVQTLWNQLLDQINGGSLYDPAGGLEAAFQKERQPVYFVSSLWQTWYRLLETEAGLKVNKAYVGLHGRVAERRGGWRGEPSRAPVSPFGVDTHTFSTYVQALETQLGLRAQVGSAQLAAHYLTWQGRGIGWRFFSHTGLKFLSSLEWPRARLELAYQRWLSAAAPPPEWRLGLRLGNNRLQVQTSYSSQNLPWFYYQAYPLPNPQNTQTLLAEGGFTLSQDTLPPLRLTGWGLVQRYPVLAQGSRLYQPSAVIAWYGMRAEGRWERRWFGVWPTLSIQQATGPDSLQFWFRQVPLLSGWLGLYGRWQLPGRKPVYRLGLRLRGSTSYKPPRYEPAYALFYSDPAVPIQGGWLGVDAFFTVHLGRVLVYLRVENATEGLLVPGSFWSYPYPWPGRAFSFGVLWDLYN